MGVWRSKREIHAASWVDGSARSQRLGSSLRAAHQAGHGGGRARKLLAGFSKTVIAVSIVFAVCAFPIRADAEGRCTSQQCLTTATGDPGELVEVLRPTWRVVLNEPRPQAVGYNYRPEAPTIVLVETVDGLAASGLTFEVPDVPPGRYEIVIYDATSYWWQSFTVSGSGFSPNIWLLGAILITAIAIASSQWKRRTAHRRSRNGGSGSKLSS